jgi:hypothetical protein
VGQCLNDQVEACNRVFASDTRWTVVRGSDLEEGESQGLPVWSRHVGDPVLESNITRRVDFALFMVAALEIDEHRDGSPPQALLDHAPTAGLGHSSGSFRKLVQASVLGWAMCSGVDPSRSGLPGVRPW